MERPVIIISPPRSGSSLLFETLALAPELWTIGGESHAVIEGIEHLQPGHRGWDSNVLGRHDADPDTVSRLHERFNAQVRDRTGRAPAAGDGPIRLLEKTPKNALRIPFLAEVFPDACFVYLYRSAAETIASMLAGWRSGIYVSYPSLPGWRGPLWSFLLVPGWQELAGRPLAEVVAQQWATAVDVLLDDFEALPAERRLISRYNRLVADPAAEIGDLCGALGLAWDRPLSPILPLSRSTLTPPAPDKWMAHRDEVEVALRLVTQVERRAAAVTDGRR